MEESAIQAIYTGAYIFVFIVALTVTLYLFGSITDFSKLAYRYNNEVQGSATIVDAPVEQNILLNVDEVVSYYYNYVKKDLYGDEKSKGITNYIVDIEQLRGMNVNTTSLADVYNKLTNNGREKDAKYIIKYDRYTTTNNGKNADVNISITKASQEDIDKLF